MLRCNAVLLCAKAHCHAHTNHHSLLDIFTSLSSDRFPLWHDFTIWLWLTGDDGKGKLEVICDKEDEEHWFTYVLDVDIDMTGRSEYSLAYLANGFCFPRPGTFRFRVMWQDTLIATQWLRVGSES
jgi:hypothetical protein